MLPDVASTSNVRCAPLLLRSLGRSSPSARASRSLQCRHQSAEEGV
jgi:hypothetical protein